MNEPADIIALSLGSEFAAKAALEAPELVHSLTLISPSGFSERREKRASQQANALSRSNNTSSGQAGTTSAPATAAAPATEAAPAASGGSSRAQQAVSAAMSKVGSRYAWGNSGPSRFDCSGLTSWAYRQVGINLPRSSRAQTSVGTHVSKSDLRPGDLVFYYSPVSHVAIYVGNGRIVDAANPRTGVRTASLNSMPYNTARRVS